MHAWTEEMLGGPGSPIRLPAFEAMEGARERDMKYLHQESVEAWGAPFVEQGRVEGQRDMLARQARSRFGADAAARLSEALSGVPSGRLLADAGALVVSCGSASEFAERLREFARD